MIEAHDVQMRWTEDQLRVLLLDAAVRQQERLSIEERVLPGTASHSSAALESTNHVEFPERDETYIVPNFLVTIVAQWFPDRGTALRELVRLAAARDERS